MVSSIRSLGKSGLNPKGFIVTGVVLLLVLALFFIPELVNFQKTLSVDHVVGSQVHKAQQDLAALNSGLSQDSRATDQEERSTSLLGMNPLDEVSAMLNPGYIEQVRAKKVVQTMPKTPGKVESRDGIPKLSWDTLRSSASTSQMQQAENEAALIAKQLPPRAAASRFALLSFASSLRVVRNGAEKVMQPVEAVRYVDYTRLAVVRSMEQEGVDREFYNRFVTLSLGPVLDAQRGVGIADVPKVFSPNLALTRVSVFRSPTRGRRFVEEGSARVLVGFSGYVVGREVRQIEIYQNGIRLDRVIPGRADSEGIRTFRYSRRNQKDGRGIFTLRITDQFGQVVERSYAFYPKARQFSWQRGGYFEIPRVEPGDHRLDRFFAYGRDALVMAAGMGAFDGGADIERF